MDVCKVVLQFVAIGWILPNYYDNIIILLPKSMEADCTDIFMHITMCNFKIKIVSKILADKLASIMPLIISKEQKWFIRGRNVKDYVCLAFVIFNILDKKSFGDNLALKVDVNKTFDTLNWDFLLKVLEKFGFGDTFCQWTMSIMESTHIQVW